MRGAAAAIAAAPSMYPSLDATAAGSSPPLLAQSIADLVLHQLMHQMDARLEEQRLSLTHHFQQQLLSTTQQLANNMTLTPSHPLPSALQQQQHSQAGGGSSVSVPPTSFPSSSDA